MDSKVFCLAVVCVFLAHNVFAESSKNVSSTNPPPKPSKDELFIDDDSDTETNAEDSDKLDKDEMMLGEEGSGMSPTTKLTGNEDMESSGSGYGPDDEDAAVGSGKKGKPGLDAEDDDEDDDINEDDDEEDDEDNEDIDKDKLQKVNTPTSTITTTTTSTTTTTTENYDEETISPKKKILLEDFNEASPNVPDIPPTTLAPPPSNGIDEHSSGNGVYISHNSHPERTSSFFAQPGILAAVIGGAVVGLLCAILVVMFIVYRMRKKDEGSYPLEETKRSPATNPYLKSTHREFYA